MVKVQFKKEKKTTRRRNNLYIFKKRKEKKQMLDLRLLYETDIMKWLIMASVVYGIFRIVKKLMLRK